MIKLVLGLVTDGDMAPLPDEAVIWSEDDSHDVDVRGPDAPNVGAFIVKAVNNHEALVKALEAASEYLESDVADGFRPAHRLRAEIDTAIRNARVGGMPK